MFMINETFYFCSYWNWELPAYVVRIKLLYGTSVNFEVNL